MGWLGVTKVALGWPLYLVAVAVMGAVLLRGRTPLDLDEQAASEDSAGERRSSEPLGD